MTGVAFLGYPVCRNEKCVKLSVEFSINLFQTTFTLRAFPRFAYPLLALLIPSRYRIRRNLKEAEQIIASLIDEHDRKRSLRDKSELEKEEGSLLEWMLDHATGTEAEAGEMANRQLILTLASIHTTSMAVAHALFDLCAHPEYFEPLINEAKEVFQIKKI